MEVQEGIETEVVVGVAAGIGGIGIGAGTGKTRVADEAGKGDIEVIAEIVAAEGSVGGEHPVALRGAVATKVERMADQAVVLAWREHENVAGREVAVKNNLRKAGLRK